MYTVSFFSKSTLSLSIASALLLLGSACSDSTSDESHKSFGYGNLIDSAVEGVSFVSDERSGLTGANGEFSYVVGVPLRFSIGGIILGETDGREVLSPIQLQGGSGATDPAVSNLARFLQTLDDDGDPSNGILITSAVRQAAANMSVNFSQAKLDFASDANVLDVVSTLTALTTAQTRSLVSDVDAEAHLTATLVGELNNAMGTYSGTETFTLSNCSLAQMNGNYLFTGDMTFVLGSATAEGITFTASGEFSGAAGIYTITHSFSMNTAANNSLLLNGDIQGAGTLSLSVNNFNVASYQFSGSGVLNGNVMTYSVPDQTGVAVASGETCDVSNMSMSLAH